MKNKEIKNKNKPMPLTEKRVREICQEEIIKWHRESFVPMSRNL